MMKLQKISGVKFAAGTWPLAPDKATALFIHGSGGTHRLWKAQLDALVPRVNTLAIDLPGHGASDGAGFNRVIDYAEAVLAFVDAVDAPRPVPCGLSLGGAIVQQLLIDRPNRFPAGILAGTGARLKVLPAIFEAIESDYDGFLDMLSQYAFSPVTKAAAKKTILKDTAKSDPFLTYGDYVACNGFDVMEQLQEIQAPVLVVTAEDDKMTPPKYGDFLEKRIPNASRAHILEAGHHMPAEQPDKFNQAVVGFLDAQGF
jgi:pimeloyl-ACP methyl ester carboxylesterase